MSFQQGVTGLNAASRNLDVIGNNVANASTVGAKASRAEFEDIYARVGSGSGVSIGLGVGLSAVTQKFSQGSISTTDNALDMAINGNGFFQLKDPNGATQYSRNGQFQVDRGGNIVNAQGMQLLGHPINANSVAAGQAVPLTVPTSGVQPSATTKIGLEINLDSRDKITYDAAASLPIDVNDDTTYNDSTSLTVYDAKGQAASLTFFFQKTANNTWNVYAEAGTTAVNPDASGNPQSIAQIQFSNDGTTPVSTPDPVAIDVPPAGTAGALTEAIPGVTIDINKLTQFGMAFGPTDVSQNGTPAGKLASVAVQADGTLVASYSSGQSLPIARIELASFRNAQGLQPLGGNAWAATYESGDPVLGDPGGGNMGLLQGKAVEESNIDLTGELVNMMVAQRIYQANAQTIKTQDSVMQTLVSLR